MANLATREAYGKALVELGKTNPNIVVLDADLSKSTKTASLALSSPIKNGNVMQERILMAMNSKPNKKLKRCKRKKYCKKDVHKHLFLYINSYIQKQKVVHIIILV